MNLQKIGEILKTKKAKLIVNEGSAGCRAVPTLGLFEYAIDKSSITLYSNYEGYKSNNHDVSVDYSYDAAIVDNIVYILVESESKDWSSKQPQPFVRKGAYLVSVERGKGNRLQIHHDRIPRGKNIPEALEYMKPAEVKKAEDAGKKVYRQGDIFFIENGRNNFKAISHSHSQHNVRETETHYVIEHGQHKNLKLSKKLKWKAVQRKRLFDAGSRD